MKAWTIFLLLWGIVTSTQLTKLSPELDEALRGHLTTCTACHIATGVVKDNDAVTHANFLMRNYCNEAPSKYHQLCYGVVDKIFKNALELTQHYTIETDCEAFCCKNAKQLTTETFCSGVTHVLDNTESMMDMLELKIKSVCSTEVDAEGCFEQFKKWRPFITNFLKRSIIRVVNELEPQTLCKIGLFVRRQNEVQYDFLGVSDLTKIPKAEKALKMPKIFPQLTIGNSDSLTCTLCEYMIEGACEMLTNPNTYNSYRFSLFLQDECSKILPANLASTICSQLSQLLLSAGYALINQLIWPNACHLVDKSCAVNPNPMCVDVNNNG